MKFSQHFWSIVAVGHENLHWQLPVLHRCARTLFGNSEICNFSGFDVLCQRMKEGRKVCKDYADFLRQRAQVQELYGKALIKLSKSLGGKEEIGSLRQSWEVMRTETENIGKQHVMTAGSLTEEANKIADLMEKQKMQRKHAEDQLRRTQMIMKNAMKKVLESKKTYYTRCKEKEVIEETLQSVGQNIQCKEYEKLTQKHNRIEQIIENLNLTYSSSLESLEEIHQLWENEMYSTCECFQKLEEERIDALRNSMWILTNISSLQCVNEDDMNEEIRKTLENCSIENDIELFIQLRRTGTEKPGHRTLTNLRKSNCCTDISQKLKDETEVSLKKGEIVRVINACDPDWWQIETKDNRIGYFPVIYMEIIDSE
ncbi:proline-serine-threonine phosphatase-interacting protein 1-like [Centruroides sculpturatus]|uniref:proline-serine-threonine phosphatase-interacting protein 1-like n=1 Tax=Centruroides sculpturatus TaxID=218467 RepID=UPI000C6CC53B|nr:proline-serine-threonine phosphatase-interacting protein 1-like [Centruroides sculpturatus]